MTWKSGRQEILAALRAGELQRVTGGQAAGDGWITDARRKYETAGLIAGADPESAYVTAYDAARFALVGVLAQQGLRATQKVATSPSNRRSVLSSAHPSRCFQL
jgi:hypothetical protein